MKKETKLLVFFLLVAILRFIISLIIAKTSYPLSEELEIIEISRKIYENGELNFKYSLYPFIILPLVAINGDLLLIRIFSSFFGSFTIIISYLLTKNFFLPLVIAFQPTHMYISSLGKSDPLLFIFSLISLISTAGFYKSTENSKRKYVILSALSSSACIILKYFFPVALSSFLLISVKEPKRAKEFIVYFSAPLLIIFLPLIAIQPENFYLTIKKQIYGQIYGQTHEQTQIYITGSKEPLSAILCITSSILTLTPYSILILPVIILSAIHYGKDSIAPFLFFLISSILLYLTSSHLFLHYYYPIAIPLTFILVKGFERKKYLLICFIIVSIICVLKVKRHGNMNYSWINELRREIKQKNEEILLFVPKQHFFLHYLIQGNLNMKVITKVYGLEWQKVEFTQVRDIVLVDKTYSITDTEEKDLRKIQEILISKGCKNVRNIDSFKSLKLDRFESLLFPHFKNLLFYFSVDLWRCDGIK